VTRKALVLKWGPQFAHLSGQSWTTDWTPAKVAAAPDPIVGLAGYAQQTCGIPFPTLSDLSGMRKIANEIYRHYPTADIGTLCRIVQWARNRRRRCRSGSQLLNLWRDAMADGALNELDASNDAALTDTIYRILETEQDQRWRSRLLCCADNDARRIAINDWKTYRGHGAAA
jgi:hypothetical protein